MMRDERTSRSTSGYLLQDRGLHLGITCLVKHLTHGAQDSSAFEERVLDTLVHHEVHVTLTVTLLRIIESVISHTIFVFYDRQRFQTLCQHGQFLRMNADFAHLCAENESLNADEIADIEQFLEYHIVHLLLYGRRLLTFGYRCLYIVSRHIHLNTAFRVLNLNERSLAHDAFGHQTTCNTHRVSCVPFLHGFILPLLRRGQGGCLIHKPGFDLG